MSSQLKKTYDRKVLATFDLIGCYFIDLFYNDLFLKAKHSFTTGHSKSLTETYRSHILWFMRGIAEKPKNYIEVMKKLLDYYNRETKTITNTLSELENKILSQFIPPEYYQDFTNANREKVLHDIIIRAINQLGEVTLEPSMLGKIIDDHMNAGNIQLLREKLTDIFIAQREEYYSKFVDEISRANGNKSVSREQFKKLKAEYAEELKRRIAAESERDRAVGLLEISLRKINELENSLLHRRAGTVSDGTVNDGTVNYGTVTDGTVNGSSSVDAQDAHEISPHNIPARKLHAEPSRTTPVRKTYTVESAAESKKDPSPVKSKPFRLMDTVGLKMSELDIGRSLQPQSAHKEMVSTSDTRPVATRYEANRDVPLTLAPAPAKVMARDRKDETESQEYDLSAVVNEDTRAKEDMPVNEDTPDTTDSDESEDSEELYKKQRDALSKRGQIQQHFAEDDPGFGA